MNCKVYNFFHKISIKCQKYGIEIIKTMTPTTLARKINNVDCHWYELNKIIKIFRFFHM